MARLPNFNPLVAPVVICCTCGKEMARSLKRNPRKEVEALVYTCINPETGCSYFIETDVRLTQQMHVVREVKN